MISDDKFKIKSTSGKDDYTVHVFAEKCSTTGHKCVPHCVAPECYDLCRCIMECSCIDYKSGHICKHTHKVTTAHRNVRMGQFGCSLIKKYYIIAKVT